MRTKLIPIGNSLGVRLPKAFIDQFDLNDGEIDLVIEERGILISAAKKARDGWSKRFAEALEKDDLPQNDIFEGSQNEFDKTEWTW